MVINSTMRATDSSIGIGSLLTDRAYCSRMGIKMSGTSFRTSAPFPTNQTISLDVLADKTTYTRYSKMRYSQWVISSGI
ncbi:uncharacterized protein OCT59_002568 [Rhizophagus irregularis]|uniref:uncharacterized protein n=1 Tax=Rhizophagus irregularis TaxID=588596 RepID=UPI003321FB7E|nr:hypothetical protein OCT59_002568 [Rhizophagus irregularis]